MTFYDFLLYSRTVPTVLYICVLRLSMTFYDFLLYSRTVPTVLYICVLRLSIVPLSMTFYCILELFPRCCIFVCYGCRLFSFYDFLLYSRTVPTVLYICVLRLSMTFYDFLLYSRTVPTVLYICVLRLSIVLFYDFLLYSRTVPTVLYICVLRLSIVPLSMTFYCILELFPRCCIFVCYGCRLFFFLWLSIVF